MKTNSIGKCFTIDKILKIDFQNFHISRKVLKNVGLRRNLSTLWQSLHTIYKTLKRPNLDYSDIIYDHPLIEFLSNRVESVQYKAALAMEPLNHTRAGVTGAIQGSSREKLYQELSLEHLHQRRWMRRLCLFYKVFHNKVPKYIQSHENFRKTIKCINFFLLRDRVFSKLFSTVCYKGLEQT